MPPLTVAATLGGHGWFTLGEPAPVRLAAGDIALITASGGYTIADDRTPVRDPRRTQAPSHRPPADPLGPRTYGDGLPGPPSCSVAYANCTATRPLACWTCPAAGDRARRAAYPDGPRSALRRGGQRRAGPGRGPGPGCWTWSW
ncbi:cupin domain-containing protein [Actinomadura fulvescens]